MDNITTLIISVAILLAGLVMSIRILQLIRGVYLEMKACITYRAMEILYPEVKLNENHLDDSSNDGE